MSERRVAGLDFARALAFLGMLLVNYKTVMNAGENGPDWLVAFAALFEGRASTLFVVLAGIGVSFLTRKARETSDPVVIRSYRSTLQKRSIFLFVIGLLLYAAGWSGDILHNYGVYMLIASLLIAASGRTIVIAIVSFMLPALAMQLVLDYEKGWNPLLPLLDYLDFWTIEGFTRHLLFNGYHPIFPWVCFFLLGMWLGTRNLSDGAFLRKVLHAAWMTAVFLETVSRLLIRITAPALGSDVAVYLFTTKAYPPGLLFVLSGSSTAVAVIMLCIRFAEKFADTRFTRMMTSTGQLTLTYYVSHVFIGIGGLMLFGRLDNSSLGFASVYAAVFFAISVLFSSWWRSNFSRGPLEALMRKMSG